MSLIGVDVGTSALKGVLIDNEGRQFGTARAYYSQTFPKPGWCEQDPDIVEAALHSVLSELAQLAAAACDPVSALSMSTSGSEFTPVDVNGRVIRPTIMSMDSRGDDIVAWWSQTVGRQLVYEITGLAVHPMHPLVRLMWLREHEPDNFARIHRILCWGEYLAYRLGVESVATDHSMASVTMAFDIHSLRWSDTLLQRSGVDGNLFVPAVPTGTPLGIIGTGQANQLGLSPNVVVAAGGFDQAMAGLGSGLVSPRHAGVGTGSWEALLVLADAPQTSSDLLTSGYMSGCYVTPGMYFTVANNSGGGSVLQWLADTLGQEEQREARRRGVDYFDLLLAQCSDRPSGLLVVPHFAGSFNPWMDPKATGAIVGLTLATSRADLIRGILEGITFEFRENFGRLERAGCKIDNLVATGGGARSPLWLQLRADIIDRPVHTINIAETGCFAAACVAGASIGVFDDVADTVSALVKPCKTYEPNPSMTPRYDELFDAYQRVYPAIGGIDPYPSTMSPVKTQ